MGIRELDKRAVDSTGQVVDSLTDAQLDLPTPCREWLVKDVVGHMVDNNRNLVAKLTGTPVRARGDDVRRDYRASAAALHDVFADPGVLDRPVGLGIAGVMPARAALSVHFTDVLVHGWDLARSLGGDIALEADLVDAALRVVGAFPDVPGLRDGENALFAPAVDVAADAPAQERLLGLTGRSPAWAA